MITVKPHISAMASYAPPWTGMDRSQYLRLDLNENTGPPPPLVLKALQDYIAAGRIQMYPDYAHFMPRLARYAGVAPEQLLLTNGSDQAIEVILRAFLGFGDAMVMAQPGFPIFNQVAGIIGATVRGVSYDLELQFPWQDFLAAADQEGTSLITIINPDNPTGSSISLERIHHVLKRYPRIPVIVDEAYFEYTGVTALNFLDSCPNLIVTRTFSKAFAMAGLRMGYIIARPEIISQFNKIRGPFDINSCALIVAEAQLDEPDGWQRYIQETMTQSMPALQLFFRENGITHYPGAAHFLLVKPKDRNQAVQFLKENNILVRPMVAPLIQDTFRMSVGTLAQTQRFIEVYGEYLRKFEQ